jgi:hypothetical protein
MIEHILLDVSGTLTDITNQLEDYHNGNVTATISDTRFLYIGSQFPFNSKYFKLGIVNATASNITYEYHDGSVWRPFVHTQDGCKLTTAGFGQSGEIRLTPDREYLWQRQDTDDIPELVNVILYDLYWMRIKSSVSISPRLDWVGRLFCNSNDIKAEYPDLGRSAFFTAFASGKTDWEEQIVTASRLVVEDLISKNIISNQNQILLTDKLKSATVSKTAELIFSALGNDHVDDMNKAHANYKDRLHNKLFGIDLNSNARIEPQEVITRTGRLRR